MDEGGEGRGQRPGKKISKLGCRMGLARGRIAELYSAFRQLYLAFADFL
jgi:hypothetical protein